MPFFKSIYIYVAYFFYYTNLANAFPANGQTPFGHGTSRAGVLKEAPNRALGYGRHNVSVQLFAELEELARIVDIAYCVGMTGIYRPFECASRCDEFPGYELVDTWNTGPLMSDSCGYIALDHVGERIIVAFRGTYSITNTIVDLTTIPQEYVPYPGDPDEDPKDYSAPSSSSHSQLSWPWQWFTKAKQQASSASSRGVFGEESAGGGRGKERDDDRPEGPKCNNCTVHMGFFSSWKNTRRIILPHLTRHHILYPNYNLHLVGHSLGGAVAALAGLETHVLGWNPTVTTFGEPRVGNLGLNKYLDELFALNNCSRDKKATRVGEHYICKKRYRRMTHMNDPVPLLPLSEWSFHMHAGEIYISKAELQPSVPDLRLCDGDEDPNCIFGAEIDAPFEPMPDDGAWPEDMDLDMRTRWGLPARYRMWQLFFAHRDYFWRLGLCVPGGDPVDWGRRYNNLTGGGMDGL